MARTELKAVRNQTKGFRQFIDSLTPDGSEPTYGGGQVPPSIVTGRPVGDNDDMEHRVKVLEDAVEKIGGRLSPIEMDIAIIKSNYSTKADVSEAKFQIIAWVVTAVFFAQVLPYIIDWLRSVPK